MGLVKLLLGCAKAIRALFVRRYHPERHYMRGPGPACARRQNSAHG